jgi:YHS domain-containing protein
MKMKLGMTMIMAGVIGIFAASAAFAGSLGCQMGNMQMAGQSGDMDHSKMPQEEVKNAGATGIPTAMSAYPIDYCLVSGEKLGEMGDPVIKMYEGREVRFCCGMCPATFEKDQAKYLKKLDEAIIAKEKPTYPLQTCVVSGEKLEPGDMGDPVDYIYKNHLVRFCCNMCPAAFNKDPDKYLKKISDAYSAAETSKDDKTAPEPVKEVQHEEHQH